MHPGDGLAILDSIARFLEIVQAHRKIDDVVLFISSAAQNQAGHPTCSHWIDSIKPSAGALNSAVNFAAGKSSGLPLKEAVGALLPAHLAKFLQSAAIGDHFLR